ncbi:hypothetical protein B7Y94_05295 [Candidatus Saccharibacteria bacterium 32-49-12]|nr:MAG: hypothetical protein B7Y94_05295 [Candidatus Saccharibacteria bacterium 32-49-12]
MAVNKQQKYLRDYWRYFQQTTLIILSGVILIVAVITAVVLYITGVTSDMPTALTVLAIVVLTSGLVLGFVYWLMRRPLRDLMAAIIHISGEPTDTTPPNPNDGQYERSGFKEVLQTLYQLSKDRPVAATSSPDSVVAITENALSKALNTTNCGFVLLDKASRITFANKAAPIAIDQDGTKRLNLYFNGSDNLDNWLVECEHNAVNAEKTWERIPNKLPDEDDRRFFDVVATYSKGAEAEVILALVDRTAKYLTSEQDLDFIAFAAHELRGPITVIRGYLDVLQNELQEYLAPDQVELFHRLSISANRLSGYINNILNTSRYDRRHLRIRLAESTVDTVYDMIRDDMTMRAVAQNRLLSVKFPADLPTIAADPASLSEVFGNIIDNAIKYSSEGGAINVTAVKKGDFVDITIQDHGIGMPGNVVSNLFQKFYRSHRSRETVAGTGIGLYISKAIVESHGGTISVQSEEGRGSIFTISIPTYQSVADKLQAGNNSNEGIIGQGSGWIKNHSMYRG